MARFGRRPELRESAWLPCGLLYTTAGNNQSMGSRPWKLPLPGGGKRRCVRLQRRGWPLLLPVAGKRLVCNPLSMFPPCQALSLAMPQPVLGRGADAYVTRRGWPLAPPRCQVVRMLGFAGHLSNNHLRFCFQSAIQPANPWQRALQLATLLATQAWGSAWVRVDRTEACVPTDQLQHSGEQPLCSSLVPPPPLPPPPTCA